ncbi:Nramp family divalent metal transporter [Dictyobacter kobayashii]|uniref:Divalent metal cation transporter n=1 Tax=Dictyobacter kobayashii TaxID=2014872 RepID=A0A402AD91_9CHLR|nr:Nramp family divalent metal transporter [Dictyobacter kobayashii]GCE17046.1 hypothetical protein KDK_08460 [Dictyobacter kobayashii]
MDTTRQKAQKPQKDRAERRTRRRSRFRLSRSSPVLKLFAILGPGLIAANAGNDAGGIATFSTSGATYQYNLLWALVVAGFCLAIVQEMCARMGVVTGKGLADLIREEFGVRWTVVAMLALLVANTGVTISEFLGIAASVQVFANNVHTPWVYVVVPACGIAVWWLVIKGSYRRVEKIFLFMSLGFLAYIPAAFASHPNWGAVGHSIILPTLLLVMLIYWLPWPWLAQRLAHICNSLCSPQWQIKAFPPVNIPMKNWMSIVELSSRS